MLNCLTFLRVDNFMSISLTTLFLNSCVKPQSLLITTGITIKVKFYKLLSTIRSKIKFRILRMKPTVIEIRCHEIIIANSTLKSLNSSPNHPVNFFKIDLFFIL